VLKLSASNGAAAFSDRHQFGGRRKETRMEYGLGRSAEVAGLTGSKNRWARKTGGWLTIAAGSRRIERTGGRDRRRYQA
jgi:hypothetical protein